MVSDITAKPNKANLSRHTCLAIFIWCIGFFLATMTARAQNAAATPPLTNLILLAVEVDKYSVSDTLSAYQVDGKIFLPLCQLADQLTILLHCEMDKGYVSGFILTPERGFELSIKEKVALLNKKSLPFDAQLIRQEQDDFYVATSLLEAWLPLKLQVNLSRLVLEVNPLEALPLQLRIERERQAAALHSEAVETPDFPHYPDPYLIFSAPFIDQSFSLNVNQNNGQRQITNSSTTYLAADFLGMESSLFYNNGKQNGIPSSLRVTFSRNDPEANLFGILRSRSVSLGNLTMLGVEHVARSGATGNGFSLSNLPLSHPNNFDKYTLTGELLPGWDVELYFNDALVGYQQSQPNGKYLFSDQQLIFGNNRFRLVFHGPQGQVRVETRTFLLNQSLAKPGEFLYSVGVQRDTATDGLRAVSQFEFGVNKRLSITGGQVILPPQSLTNNPEAVYYSNLGLRSYLDAFVFGANIVRANNNRTLQNFSLNTELGRIALTASHTRLDRGFISEAFLPQSDPIQSSNKLRLDGNVPLLGKASLPITAEFQKDSMMSGNKNTYFTGRTTTFTNALTLTNEFISNTVFGGKTTTNSLQVSRNISKGGIRGQVTYGFAPQRGITTAALIADYALKKNYLANVTMTRDFLGPQNTYTFALNKSLGRYTWRIGLGLNRPGGTTFSLQFFTSMGKNIRDKHWFFESLPLAASGSASVRVFIDKNLNGIMDGDDEPVRGAGFLLNGSNLSSKTDENGLLLLTTLPPQVPINLAINPATLEDPQWHPQTPGVHFVPRPGHMLEINLPVSMTSDLEGMVYFNEQGKKRGIGDVKIELLDSKKNIVSQIKSVSDGYYLFSSITAGNYLARVSPEQLDKLHLQSNETHVVTVHANGKPITIPGFILSPKK